MIPVNLQQHLRGIRGVGTDTRVLNVGQIIRRQPDTKLPQQPNSPVQDVQRAIQSRNRLL